MAAGDSVLTYVGDKYTTALDAAKKFAATWWTNPRAVQKYIPEPGPCAMAGRFKVVDGTRWYQIWYDQRQEAFAIRPA